jgi:threonine-phosphate decarboxylase
MVSAFAANAGIALLNRLNSYCERLPLLQRDKTTLRAILERCGLFTEILDGPSFLIARINPLRFDADCSKDKPAAVLRAKLAARRILVRDCDTIPGMPSGYLRLQARNTDDSAVLEKALREITA